MYKSQLQEYAQKAGLMHPTYDHVKEGASHEPRFKSTVWVNNQSYESAPGFPTLRSAEHAAAKVALDFLQKTQTSGVVPSPVHESGLCKNFLQEFAQKNGYSLPQYKIIRQGEEHSLVFTATVEIAGVSYSGGGAKSKKEAEIKAARTALLAIQASQPAAMGLPAVDPRPLLQSQPGQITNFVKSQNKKKKRGRANPPLIEEPLATRMKQCLGQVGGPVQLPQMHQMHQMHPMAQFSQVSQLPLTFNVPCTNQLAQTFQVNPVDYSGQSVMPVEWNQELGVTTRPAVVYSEPLQVGNFVPEDTAMTEPEWETKSAAAQGTEPPLDTKVVKVENDPTTASGNTETTAFAAQAAAVKTESAVTPQIPPTTDTAKDSQVSSITPTEKSNFVSNAHTESLVTTELKESVTVIEVHVPSASKSEELLVGPQFSASVNDELTASQVDQVSVSISEVTTKTSVSAASYDPVGAQELVTLANGELQSEILRAMNVGTKSVSSEAA